MALTGEKRQEITDELQRVISDARLEIGISKAEIRATVNAIDAWVDANATSFNNALPAGPRAVLTAKQKMFVFEYILRERRIGS